MLPAIASILMAFAPVPKLPSAHTRPVLPSIVGTPLSPVLLTDEHPECLHRFDPTLAVAPIGCSAGAVAASCLPTVVKRQIVALAALALPVLAIARSWHIPLLRLPLRLLAEVNACLTSLRNELLWHLEASLYDLPLYDSFAPPAPVATVAPEPDNEHSARKAHAHAYLEQQKRQRGLAAACEAAYATKKAADRPRAFSWERRGKILSGAQLASGRAAELLVEMHVR